MHKEGKHETPSRENMKPSLTGIHLLGACVMAGRPTAGSGDAYAHEGGNNFPPSESAKGFGSMENEHGQTWETIPDSQCLRPFFPLLQHANL